MSMEILTAIVLACQATGIGSQYSTNSESPASAEKRQFRCQADLIKCVQSSNDLGNKRLIQCITERAK